MAQSNRGVSKTMVFVLPRKQGAASWPTLEGVRTAWHGLLPLSCAVTWVGGDQHGCLPHIVAVR